MRERDWERHRERDRERQRETDRDRERQRETDRDRERQRERETIHKKTDRQASGNIITVLNYLKSLNTIFQNMCFNF